MATAADGARPEPAEPAEAPAGAPALAASERAEDYIPAAFDRIYAAFLAGDTATLDSYLDDDITIWIPPEPPLSFGKTGLDAIRSRRPADSGVNTATSVAVHDMLVHSHQDVAWERHVLVVELAGGETEVMRCTSVWRRDDSGWLQVHSHEDLLPGATYPFAAPTSAGVASA
jgi:ketosteroid isomerase-like protein